MKTKKKASRKPRKPINDNVEWRRKHFKKTAPDLQRKVDQLNDKYNKRSGMAFVINKNGYGYSVELTPKKKKDGTYVSYTTGAETKYGAIRKIEKDDENGTLKRVVQRGKLRLQRKLP